MSADTVDLRKIRAKALGYLREGRVRIVRANPAEPGERRAYGVNALVRGHLDAYETRGLDGAWWCSCGAVSASEVVADQCAHAAAVALVTGWPSAAGPLHPDHPEEQP